MKCNLCTGGNQKILSMHDTGCVIGEGSLETASVCNFTLERNILTTKKKNINLAKYIFIHISHIYIVDAMKQGIVRVSRIDDKTGRRENPGC